MTTHRSKVQQFLIQMVLPILCSIVVGFLFYLDEVFQPHYPAFQFLWTGVVASVFYYMLLTARSRYVILALLLLLCFTFLTTGSTRGAFILRDVLYVGGIGASVYFYFRYFREGSHRSFLYPAFTLGGIYGIMYIVSSEIDIWIMRAFVNEHIGGDNVSAVARNNGFFGLLIGFAVGCGIALNERLFSRKKETEVITA